MKLKFKRTNDKTYHVFFNEEETELIIVHMCGAFVVFYKKKFQFASRYLKDAKTFARFVLEDNYE